MTLDIKKTNCRLVSTAPRRSKRLSPWMAEAAAAAEVTTAHQESSRIAR